jgi:hypothetical protein
MGSRFLLRQGGGLRHTERMVIEVHGWTNVADAMDVIGATRQRSINRNLPPGYIDLGLTWY